MVSTVTGENGVITPATISAVTGISASNKVYNGVTAAALVTTNAAFTGMIPGDLLNVWTASGAFVDKNVGVGKTVNISSIVLGGTDARNYTLANATASSTADITSKALTVTASAASKVYDGLAFTGGNGVTYAGFVKNESSTVLGGTLGYAGSSQGATNAGSYAITPNGLTSSNYAISYTDGTLTVTPASLSLSPISLTGSRAYDGSNIVGASIFTLSGLIGGQTLSLTGFGTVADKNVGTNKPVALGSLTLGNGTGLAKNYSFTGGTQTASITPVALTVKANADAKFVTQTDAAGFSGVSYAGFVGNETAAVLGGTLAITRSNSSTNGAGTYAGVLTPSGYTASNYTLNYVGGDYTIVPASQLLIKVDNSSVTYGNAPTYTVSSAQYMNGGGVITTLTQGTVDGNTYSYTDAAGGAVTFTLSPTGATTSTSGNINTGNYSIAATNPTITGSNFTALSSSGTLSVVQKEISASPSTVTKVYDGTTAMTGASLNLTGVVTNDAVTISGVGQYSQKNVGANLFYVFPGSNDALAGADRGNYYISAAATGFNWSITPASISAVTGITAGNKVYDGGTSAVINTANAAFTGMISGDLLSVATASGAFGNKNVGTGKAVSITGISLDGLDARNYTLTSTIASTTANITAKALTVSATGSSKVYDGTTTAAVALSDNRLNGDVLTLSDTAANFIDKNAAYEKTINIVGINVTGTDAGNYSFNTTATASADITAKTLTATVAAPDKVYDGNVTAAPTLTITEGLVSGETVTATGTASFNSKNVLTANLVTVGGITLADGTGLAGNYSLAAGQTVAAHITPASLAITGVSANNKVYDATMTVPLSGTAMIDALPGDAVTVLGSGNGTFANKNVGTGKAVTVSGYTLGGTDAGNYAVVQPSGLTANITPAALTVTANGAAKFVSQADASGFSGVSYTGFVGGETSTALGGTLAISRSNSGTNTAGTYPGVLTPAGYTSGNYTISYVNGAYTIVPAQQLLLRVQDTSITYGTAPTYSIASAAYLSGDGTTIMTLAAPTISNGIYTFSDGAGSSASFGLVPTAAANSSSGNINVGNYAITASNPTISGGNFSALNFTGNLAVVQKAITASIDNVSKVYDGTTAMTGVTLGLTGKAANDVVTVSGGGSFSSKNVRNNVSYTLNNLTLAGGDMGNYYLSGGTSFSGENGTITPATISAVTGISASSKVYDGDTTATLNTAGAAFTGMIAGDVLNVMAASGAFSNKNVGIGKAVSVTGISLGGTDVGN